MFLINHLICNAFKAYTSTASLQGQTMSMMYKIIAKELEMAGLSDHCHPQDYLNFYCLGKREAFCPGNSGPLNQQSESRSLVRYLCILESICRG